MKILAFNAGSSSIKYTLFDASDHFKLLVKGLAERIGQPHSAIRETMQDQSELKQELSLPDHRTAMHAFQLLLRDRESIHAVGHRIVHGGEIFTAPTLMTPQVLQSIKELARFVPLHGPPNVTGIEILQEMLPNIPHVAIFDTALHQEMPAKAFLYGLPRDYYQKYKIRKYGFHGTNHLYVAKEAARHVEKSFESLKIITCHLGNGCSVNAFLHGQSVDSSMGLTPLEGLVMGSRCGDLDPSVLLFLMEQLNLKPSELLDLLNKKSGLVGLCGKNDMRDIIAMAHAGESAFQDAIDVFVYRIQKYIGAYIAALNGVDVIVFTGGIGENSSYIRAQVAHHLSFMHTFVDEDQNNRHARVFSTPESHVQLMTIPANEEQVIAQQTYDLAVNVTVHMPRRRRGM